MSAMPSCNGWKAGVVSDKLEHLAEEISSEVLRMPPGFFLLLIVKRETSWFTKCNRKRINSQTLQIAKDAEIHKWLLDMWHREKEEATRPSAKTHNRPVSQAIQSEERCASCVFPRKPVSHSGCP